MRSRTRRTHRAVPRRGAAATEFALTLPLILLLVFGCVDFGRGIGIYIVTGNAARVGAEYGATHQFTDYTKASWETQLRAAVQEEMAHVVDFNLSDMDVDIETFGTDDDVRIVVSVDYPFRPVTTWPTVAQELHLRRTVSMRQFR